MPIQLKPLAPLDAIAALEARGYRLPVSFAWQDIYADLHARAFTVAKSAGFDILADIYSALDQALRNGTTLRDFSRSITPVLQAKGWWGKQRVTNPATGLPELAQLGSQRRLRTIFDVNMRVSYAAGHWASFERNKAVRPFLRYVHLDPQEHPRPQHQALHNLVLPVGHPFWDRFAPPNGWGCHCTLQSLSQRDVDALGASGAKLQFEPPAFEERPWTNKVTGEVRMIPDGIDPGWDYNAGRAGWRAQVNEAFALKISTAPPDLAAAGVEQRVGSPEFQRFLTKPEGDMPVMTLTEATASAITSQSRVILLSAETMRKQLARHPELTPEDYLALRGLGTEPLLVLQDGARNVILISAFGTQFRFAVVKSTGTGLANFLQSYRFANAEDIARILRRPGIRVLFDRR